MIALSVWHDGIFIADVSFACSSAAAELLLWQLGLCGRAAAEKYFPVSDYAIGLEVKSQLISRHFWLIFPPF